MRPLVLASIFVVLCGAFSGLRTARLLPPTARPDEPPIWLEDYRLLPKAGEAFEVADGKWLLVPRLFADFDLQMDVELGENVDLDLLVRQVEPRWVQGEQRQFHGRFAVLRLTTRDEGPAWLSREDALLGQHGRGASLAPGMVATVWLEARGRTLRGNVAGKPLPPFEAMDDHGMLTLVATGGKAAVHRLVVVSRGRHDAWGTSRWFWIAIGALGGLVVVGVSLARGDRALRLALLGLPVALVGPLLARHVQLLPLSSPSTAPLLALLGGGMLFVAGLAWARGIRHPVAALAAVAVLGGAFWLGADRAVEALRPRDERQLDQLFGPASGSTPSEALAGVIRSASLGLRGPLAAGATESRVMLLGGQVLYGGLRTPVEHLEPMLRGELRNALRAPVDVFALPTFDGHTAQQWAMFTRFYAAGHRPRAIVFGVPRVEAEDANGVRRSWPASLENTLREARAWAKANGAGLVLFTEVGLPAELLDVLRGAERDGVPLVIAADGESSAVVSKRLAAALLPALR